MFGGAAVPGIVSLVNMLTPHGMAADAWQASVDDDLQAPFMRDGLFVMWETLSPIVLSPQAVQALGTTDDEWLNGNNTLQSHFRP